MKTKRIIVILALLGALGMMAALYMYNKPHKNYETQKVDITITSTVLVKDFESNEQEANEKYLDKMILVDGQIEKVALSDHGDLSIALVDAMFGVTCNFNSQLSDEQNNLLKDLKVGDNVKIKGRCDGYLSDVRLTQCSVVK